MSASRAEPMQVEIDGADFIWRGGRLADVSLFGVVVDAVQVGNYDWTNDRHTHNGRRSLESAARQWVRESRAAFEREYGF